MTRLTDEELGELERLEKEATPGPWALESYSEDHEGPISVVSEYEIKRGGVVSANWIAECDLQDDEAQNVVNAELIRAYRNALPALLREVRQHRAKEPYAEFLHTQKCRLTQRSRGPGCTCGLSKALESAALEEK